MSKIPDSEARDTATTVTELDATGLFCPEPVMMLHNKIRDLAGGDVLKVVATDPSTTRDIPKFCLYLEHDLLEEYEQDGKYYYVIKKSMK
jgi:tRNA 2-thiouridine synthesizing protein A